MFIPSDTNAVGLQVDEATTPGVDPGNNPFAADERTQCYSDKQIAELKDKIGSKRPRPRTLIPAEEYFAPVVEDELTIAAPVEMFEPDFSAHRALAPNASAPLPLPRTQLAQGSLGDSHTAEHIAIKEAMEAAERAATKAMRAAEAAENSPPKRRQREVPWFVEDGAPTPASQRRPAGKFPSSVLETLETILPNTAQAGVDFSRPSRRVQPLLRRRPKPTVKQRLWSWFKR